MFINDKTYIAELRLIRYRLQKQRDKALTQSSQTDLSAKSRITNEDRKKIYARKARKAGKTAADLFAEMNGKALLEFVKKYS
jgi:hypothetical protein